MSAFIQYTGCEDCIGRAITRKPEPKFIAPDLSDARATLAILCDLAKSGKANDGDTDRIWRLTDIIIAASTRVHLVMDEDCIRKPQ